MVRLPRVYPQTAPQSRPIRKEKMCMPLSRPSGARLPNQFDRRAQIASSPEGVANGSHGPRHPVVASLHPTEPRFDEAGKGLPGPEHALARRRALLKRAEWNIANVDEAAASAGT